MKSCSPAVILALVLAGANVAGAATTVWAFNASFGNPHIQAYDLATGNAVADFLAPNGDAQRGRANGRGIAVVGTKIYYTLADTPNVYVTDTVTHEDLKIAFTTPLTPGINSLAWDGSSFWMVASQPADPTKPADGKVYQYSPTGTLLKTVVLAGRENTNLAPNGLEITGSGIVVNRGSVPYDLYDINGNTITAGLITATFRTTGIAFDGVNYIVSDLAGASDVAGAGQGILAIFDKNGTWVKNVPLTGANVSYGLVDLAVVIDATTPGPNTPTISAGGVVNGASFLPGVVPGSWLTIKGSNLATANYPPFWTA
jgi:hypothetical protein